MMPGSQPRIYSTKLPCAPAVTHGDGKQVSATNPAKGGEELVAYAVGLGQTNPPLTAGVPPSTAAPTSTLFAIDFNYRPNALATQPAGPSFFGAPDGFPTPVFTGATAGFVGLYQINFIVPPAPVGLLPCVDTTAIVPFTNVVQSNLTVSVGSAFSFDGAGICVHARLQESLQIDRSEGGAADTARTVRSILFEVRVRRGTSLLTDSASGALGNRFAAAVCSTSTAQCIVV
jgi:hypothetical protein